MSSRRLFVLIQSSGHHRPRGPLCEDEIHSPAELLSFLFEGNQLSLIGQDDRPLISLSEQFGFQNTVFVKMEFNLPATGMGMNRLPWE